MGEIVRVKYFQGFWRIKSEQGCVIKLDIFFEFLRIFFYCVKFKNNNIF